MARSQTPDRGSGELERLRSERDEAHERIAGLETAVVSLQSQLERLRRDRADALREADANRRQLAEVYDSTTWRVGRVLLALPLRARRAAAGCTTLRRLLRRGLRPPPVSPTGSGGGARAADVDTAERGEFRAVYEAALGRERFSGSATGLVIAVSTTRLGDGRGDLYTAVGLGRHLEALGYEVVYRAPAGWYDLPDGTDVVLSLLAERTAMLDPLRLPAGVEKIAWVRNLTERWAASGTLPFYDGVLCSSQSTLRQLRRSYRGPIEMLRIGVDEELFPGPAAAERADLVVATVNAWGSERRLHRTLRALRIEFPFALLGQQRGVAPELAPFAGGTVSFFALPRVYGQAALVLDDLQDSNVAHGNINSRIFESLACGALPIANAAAGLAEAGLSDVPVAADAEALGEAVGRFRADPGARDRLVARLQDVVLRQHTYQARAQAFHTFRSQRLAAARGQASEVVLGFFPDYRATNPYQDMLYSRAAAHGVAPVPVDQPLTMADSPALGGRPFVFHVHWTAPILGPARSRRDAEERCDRFIGELDALKGRGAHVMWTVHNVLPHECRFHEVETRLRAGLASRCDVVHVMCPETAGLLPGEFAIPPERLRVVPHGSYVDVYPNVVSPQQSRLELGLAPEQLVLLFLGGIRSYKGLHELLDAFSVVSRERAEYRLVVAGPPGQFHELADLERRCEEHPAVLPLFAHVPDVDLQVYLNACDVVVLPHRTVLNSGGLHLAWSFGRPVIARRGGCLTGQVTPPAGRLFEGQDGLVEALRAAPELRTDEARRASYERAVAYPYTAMSEEFCTLVSRLVTEKP